ncbi:hypothetical protein [Streptomyces chryseus]
MRGSGDENHHWWRKPSNWIHEDTWTWINAVYFKSFMERHVRHSARSTSTAFTGDIIL